MYEDRTSGKMYDMGVEVGKKSPTKSSDARVRKTRLFMKTRDFDKLQRLASDLRKSAWELEQYTDIMRDNASGHHSKGFGRTKEKVGDILDSMTDDLTSFIDEMYPDG